MDQTAKFVEALIDENNNDTIKLYNEKNEEVEFEKVAFIPTDDRIFAILKPVVLVEGSTGNEGYVFEVIRGEQPENLSIALVQDEESINLVFAKYQELCDKALEN